MSGSGLIMAGRFRRFMKDPIPSRSTRVSRNPHYWQLFPYNTGTTNLVSTWLITHPGVCAWSCFPRPIFGFICLNYHTGLRLISPGLTLKFVPKILSILVWRISKGTVRLLVCNRRILQYSNERGRVSCEIKGQGTSCWEQSGGKMSSPKRRIETDVSTKSLDECLWW